MKRYRRGIGAIRCAQTFQGRTLSAKGIGSSRTRTSAQELALAEKGFSEAEE